MPALNAISPDKLLRLIGTPSCPRILDLRAGPQLIPSSVPMTPEAVRSAPQDFAGSAWVVVCRGGHETSQGTAAWLRSNGVKAEILEGGFGEWRSRAYPLVDAAKLPPRDPTGRTYWVTRSRPKVDRIACPWLIRRFVDPDAVFLFVAPPEVEKVAAEFSGAPFDVDGVFWSHRGELCTFDAMLAELGLIEFDALARLAVIVRGADTARPDLAPQSAGLLAASLGLSRMFADDLDQLEAGMTLYDALYRWCRDAVDETHDWVSHTPKRKQLA
ncbi:MAG TPA: sulfurtransferase/chromate resistance protein [Sphingomicrobium sp.]|nr:sulfurtransferase/chromate resistance protein [Sphingomicrobium sp.]